MIRDNVRILVMRGFPNDVNIAQPLFNNFQNQITASFICLITLLFLPGYSKNAPAKDYSLDSSSIHRTYNAFTSISILASLYGNGILPEIQVCQQKHGYSKITIKLLLLFQDRFHRI